MKKISLVLLAILVISTLTAQNKKINIKKSVISWTGKKVTGEHSGTINFKEGTLLFEKKKLTGGTFVADMTTLSNTDQTGKDKAKLEGHLKSSDFFNVGGYKTAELIIKKISEKKDNLYTITADLTLKGKTNPVKFDLQFKGNTASTEFSIDRTKFGIQYGSGSFFDDLGDGTIYDDFDLKVKLAF
ncbi:MAG: YceI family protein [Burkholderiales bacterium]|nr:YceI family protein [Flavobacterium sp.]